MPTRIAVATRLPTGAGPRELLAGASAHSLLHKAADGTAAAILVTATRTGLATTHAGHALDASIAMLGPLAEPQASTTRQLSEVAVTGEAGAIARTIRDHIVTQSCSRAAARSRWTFAAGRPAPAGSGWLS